MKKLVTILYILFLFTVSIAKTTVIERDEILRLAVKDLYGVFDRVSSLYTASYGTTGQPIYLKSSGKNFVGIRVYVDGMLVTDNYSNNFDFSTISLDQVERVIIDDNTSESSAIRVDIITRDNRDKELYSEIYLRDAFLNYRDLGVTLAQDFTDLVAFQIYANFNINNDNREGDDDFEHEYERQDYGFMTELPTIGIIDSELNSQYSLRNYYNYENDTLKTKEERFYVRYNGRLNKEIVDSTDISFNVSYINFQDSKLSARSSDKYMSTLNIDNKNPLFNISNKSNYTYMRNYNISDEFILDNIIDVNKKIKKSTLGADGFLRYSSKFDYAGGIGFYQEIFLTDNTYLKGDENYFIGDEGHNNIKFSSELYNLQGFLGYRWLGERFNGYAEGGFERVDDIENSNEFNYLTFRTNTTFFKNFSYKLNVTQRIDPENSGKYIYNPYLTGSTELAWQDKFYEGELTVTAALHYRYADYYTSENNHQKVSNLGFYISGQILSFQMWFSMDNLIREKYEMFENEDGSTPTINKYYHYQTIDGYGMMGRDEIWGIRWVFYN